MLKGNPVIIGEVLFDVFPQGESVLGGAPFNVAWHLQGLGLKPMMISAVGDDHHGEQVIQKMEHWGMDVQGMQLDTHHPTGRVSVMLQGSMPTYDILKQQAYDFIDTASAISTLAKTEPALLCHGSLIARTEHSCELLDTVRNQFHIPGFVDINLRKPWWSQKTIERLIHQARWVKLNEDELCIIMQSESSSRDEVVKLAQTCLTQFQLELLIVTLGEKGAFCISKDDVYDGIPVKVENMVDTVGAGDSFSAVMITGLLSGWALETSLQRALQFSAAVCGLRGATTTDRRFYENFLELWQSS